MLRDSFIASTLAKVSIGYRIYNIKKRPCRNQIHPVTVVIIASCAPLIATLLELVTGTRRLRRNFALGVVISIFGGLIATNALAALLLLVAGILGFDVMPTRPVDAAQLGTLVFYALFSPGLSQFFFIASIGKLGLAWPRSTSTLCRSM